MPLRYRPPGGGVLLDGSAAAGALLVAREGGKIGALDKGAVGQVLTTDEQGALVWATFSHTTVDGEVPIASGALLGVVRSSAQPDNVSVHTTTGVMTVNSMNVSKLYVAQGDEWVLRAGSAQGHQG